MAERFAQATPEEAQIGLEAWVGWAKRLGPALLDPGRPLGNPREVSTAGIREVATEIIGMSILRADSIDEALAMVESHHHLRWGDGCKIRVLEELPIPELDHQR